MNNEQLNIIACNSSAQVIDAIFDNDGKFEIAKHDVLEFTPSGYFKNYNHPERIFWPQNSHPYNQESLYIVDSVKQADKKCEVTLNKWDFGGPTIIGNTEQTCSIVIPTYRLIEVTKKYGFKETEQALEWFKKEFLFQTTENSYLFFRILSNTSNLEGGWLGCNYVANIESKKVDGKEYLFVSNLKKSPQKN